EWTWVQVTDAYTNQVTTFPFTEGTNSLRMGWFEEDTRVDGIMVTNDPAFDPSQKSGTATARSQTPALAAPEVSEPADTGVAMYPNPVRDRLTINYFSDSRQEARILVKSATSLSSKQLVVTLDRGWNNIELNMSGEQNGMYLVSITGADGRKCWKKIMVAD
ncbi:MAG TPA: T9SS type A sorting domain-containing protein, partial [Chryseosolibacter sp.]